MKSARTFIIFALTFLLGCLAVFTYFLAARNQRSSTEQDYSSLVNAANTNKSLSPETIEILPQIEEESEAIEEPENPVYKIEMLTISGFHEDETSAKSGEVWLGLFNRKGKSYLAPAKIKLKRFHDIGDGENKKVKTGKEIDVAGAAKPIVLLKNASNLKAGKITTLFAQNEKNYEESNLKNGFKKEFKLNGKTATLKVVNENSSEEYLSEGSKLILSSGGIEQVVFPGENDGIGETWTLHWAGDLDSDGKLDFLADLSHHYNATALMLFLSSEAEKGMLVKDVAGLFTVGC